MEEVGQHSELIRCGSCGGDPEGATLMTCLHVLCRDCVPTPASGNRGSHDGGACVCPVCCPTPLTSQGMNGTATTSHQCLTSAMTSHIASQPCVCVTELRKRAQNDDLSEEDEREDDEDNEDDDASAEEKTEKPSLVFSCPQHPHRDAEQFCLSCHKLACSKCATSVHRKCSQHLVSCAEAVAFQRPLLNSLHSKLARSVVMWQESLQREQSILGTIEEKRASVIGQIAAQREALVRALEEKEKELMKEVNTALDKEKKKAEKWVELSQWSARAAEGQLSVLEAVISLKGEAEILPLLPSLHTRVDASLDPSASNWQSSTSPDASLSLAFHVNTKLDDEVRKSDLGRVSRSQTDDDVQAANGKTGADSDVTLTLMTSFHGRAREDTCDPLLTDVLLLPTGDVILTDRDNKCVKKYNSTGHLLTRVPIPEVPSRIALVSHGKAAISVLNKKVLLFLSLLGTVRVLSSVKVKKPYCFLAAAGQSLASEVKGRDQGQGRGRDDECLLLAATNVCDVIDLITESGVLLRRLYTAPKVGNAGGVSISRPLYLHVPKAHQNHHHNHPRNGFVKDATSATSLSSSSPTAALVVDSGRRVLFGLTSDGETTFTYKPKEEQALECPLGVGTLPSGQILLVDRDKNRVVLLDGKGSSFLGQVLGEKEGLHKPCALYASVPARLALTQVDGWVKIYRVE